MGPIGPGIGPPIGIGAPGAGMAPGGAGPSGLGLPPARKEQNSIDKDTIICQQHVTDVFYIYQESLDIIYMINIQQ